MAETLAMNNATMAIKITEMAEIAIAKKKQAFHALVEIQIGLILVLENVVMEKRYQEKDVMMAIEITEKAATAIDKSK